MFCEVWSLKIHLTSSNAENKSGEGEETLIPLLQVQCRSTATRRTRTVSETRICSPEPRTSSTSLAASGDTEVGTEVTVIMALVSILRLCFLPHPQAPRPLTQSCTSHVSHGVCFRQKLQIPLSVRPETLFPDSAVVPNIGSN